MFKEFKETVARLLNSENDELFASFSEKLKNYTEADNEQKVEFLEKSADKAINVKKPALAYNFLKTALEILPEKISLMKKAAEILENDLWKAKEALIVYENLVSYDSENQEWKDKFEELKVNFEHWEKLFDKYFSEAETSEGSMAAHMYKKAAEITMKYTGDTTKTEQLLVKSLENDPANFDAFVHLRLIYMEQNEYINLIDLLEKHIEYIEDPEEKFFFTVEAAKLYLEQIDEPERAESLLKSASEIKPLNDSAKALLVEAYTKQEKWQELIRLYETELKSHSDVGVMMQLGMLWWKKIGNLKTAETYFQKLLKSDPASPLLLNFYEEYSKANDEYMKYISILQKALKAVQDDLDRTVDIARKITDATKEKNPEKAIDTWKRILKKHSDNTEARVMLEVLYKQTGKWNALIELYKEKEKNLPEDDIEGKIAILLKIAEIIEEKIGVDAMAVSIYSSILELDSSNEIAIEALIRKYENMGRWKDVISIYQNKAELTENIEEKTNYLKKIADIWLNKLSNLNKATEPLEQILELNPEDSEIMEQLQDIYTKRRNWQGLFNLKEKAISLLPEEERLSQIIELAKFAQQPLGNMNLAIDTWNRVLEKDPLDIDAIESLIFLYERQKRYPAVVEILSRKIEMSTDDEVLPLLEKAASILTDRMKSVGPKAVDMWQKVLKIRPGHAKAVKILKNLYAENSNWDALEQLFAHNNNWNGFIDTLMSSADHTDSTEQKISLYFKVADVFVEKLNKPDRAIKPYERVLSLDPNNTEAAKNLLPLYEHNKKWKQAHNMYKILYKNEESISGKKEYLVKLMELAEQKLKDNESAFEWCGQAFELEPETEEFVEKLENLAELSNNWEKLASIYSETLEKIEDKDRIIALYSGLANVYVNKLTELDEGEKAWKKVLELDSSNLRAIDGLIEIYTVKEEWDKLIETLKGKLELDLPDDILISTKEKLAFSMENYLGKIDEAISIYKEILDFKSEYIPAMTALARLYEQTEKFEELIEILIKQKEIETDSEQIKNLNYKLGVLYKKTGHFSEALEHFTRAFEFNSTDEATVHEVKYILDNADNDEIKVKAAKLLSPYYQEQEDWENYVVALEMISKDEEDFDEKLNSYRKLLNIIIRKVGDTGKGFEIAKVIFEIEPKDKENRKELRTLSKLEDKVSELKQLYIQKMEEEPLLRMELALEIAEMEDEAGNIDLAKQYYKIVLEEEASHDEAYLALERIYTAEENWEELRGLYKARIEALTEVEPKKEMLLKLSHLNEDMLSDFEAAINSYKELRELESGSTEAFNSLVNLYEISDKWQDLADLYLEELESETSRDKRIDLMYMRLDLLAHKIKDYQESIEVIKSILEQESKHEATRKILRELLDISETRKEAAEILTELYEREEDYENLVKMLEIELEFASGVEDEVEILHKEGHLYSSYLMQPEAAFEAWKRAIIKDPHNEEVRNSIEKLADVSDSFEDLIEVWKKIIETMDEDEPLILLYLEKIAKLYEHEIGNLQEAIVWYKKLLNKAESDMELQSSAALSLMNLLSSMDEWIEVIELKRRELGWIDNQEERKSIYHQIATLQEDMLEALEDAAVTYNQLLEEFPDDPEALDKLEIIYTQLERWNELVAVLEKRVEITYDPEIQRNFYTRIAMLREESLGDIEGAAEAWSAILQNNPDDVEAVRFLSRLYEQLERWVDVYDLVEKELQLTNDPEARKSLTYRLGYILQVYLEEPERAIDRYRIVLEDDPTYEKAKLALEAMLKGDEILALQAAEILEDIYKLEDNWEKLSELYGLKAEYSSDPDEKISLLIKIAKIKEEELNNPVVAFRFYGMALKEAVGSPELSDIMNQMQRLASLEDKWQDLVSLYKEVCDDVMDMTLQEQMFLTIADVSRDELDDLNTSKEYYRKVLENAPDNLHAIDALERVYEQTESWEDLLGIYIKRTELASDSSEERYNALIKAAYLCKEKLNKKEEAIEYYKDILMFRPDDAEIFRFLEELYFDAEAWEELIDLYENRIRYVEELKEAVELRFNMGEIYLDYLDEPERALESFRAALGGDPQKEETIVRLESFLDSEEESFAAGAAEVLVPIYAAKQDWKNLIRVFSLQRKMIDSPEERTELTRKIAELYETVMDDLGQALVWYGYLFKENPENHQVMDRLLGLADLLDKWEDTAEVLSEILEDAYADEPYILEISEKLAKIYAEKLSEIDKAKSCYLRILNADRTREDIFKLLEMMLLEAERWDDLFVVYRDAADFNFEPAKKNPYLYKISQLLEDKLGQTEEALEVYKEILEGDPEDDKAVSSLERLYKKLEKWDELVELLLMQTQRALDSDKMISIQLELASLYYEKLEDSSSAVDRIEEVLNVDPVNEQAIQYLDKLMEDEDVKLRVARLMQPIYKTLDDWKKLIEVYEVQIELMMDEIQKIEFLKECSKLYETRGNDELNAFKSISRAWLLDPSDRELLETMYNLSIRLNNWKELIEVLEQGLEEVYDTELQVDVLLRVARIWSETLDNAEKAIEVYRRILDIQDDHLTALEELAVLLETSEKWEELAEILDKTSDYLTDTDEEISILRKLAKLRQELLDEVENAIETWKKLVDLNETDIEALEALEILYEKTENWSELAEILKKQMDVQPDKRIEKAFKLVDVQEKNLEDNYEAIAALNTIIELEHDNVRALERLASLYRKEENWNELIDVLDKLITLEPDDNKRNELIFETALILQNEMSDINAAIGKYKFILEFKSDFAKAREELEKLLEEEDSRTAAAEILEPIYRERDDFKSLIHMYKLLLEEESDTDKRKFLLRSIAEFYERINELDNSFEYWGKLLKEVPTENEAEAQILRLAATVSKWENTVKLFDEISEDLYDDVLKKHYLMQEAAIYEESLEDLDNAVETMKKAAESISNDMDILSQLDRLLTKQEDFETLVEVIETEASAVADLAQKAAFYHRLALLRYNNFKDTEGAIEAWREALNFVNDHMDSINALESLLPENEDYISDVLDVLEPIYENLQMKDKLINAYNYRVKVIEDPMDKAANLEKAAKLAAEIGDINRSLELWAEAVKVYPEEISYCDAFMEVAEVAEASDLFINTIIEVIKDENTDDSVVVNLALKAAPFALRFSKPEAAESLYRAVLEHEEEHAQAISALEELYRVSGDTEKLIEILKKRAEIEYDPSVKKPILAEIAKLSETELDNVEGALEAWQQVIEQDESDSDAQSELMRLYEKTEKWENLIEIIRMRLNYVMDQNEGMKLRHQVAEIYGEKLGNKEESEDAWRDAYDMNPRDEAAYNALIKIYSEKEDWDSVKDMYFTQLGQASIDSEKIPVLLSMSKLAEEKLDDIDEAAGYLRQVLDIDPGEENVFASLEEILVKSEKFYELIDVLQKRSEYFSEKGESSKVIEILAKIARIWEEKLESPEEALKILQKLLEEDQSNVTALTGMARLYENQGNLEKCQQMLETAALLEPKGKEGGELAFRRGMVALKMDDEETAISRFNEAVKLDPEHTEAFDMLGKMLREKGDKQGLVRLYELRLPKITIPEKRLPVLLEMADLFMELGASEAAFPLLEEAIGIDSDNLDVQRKLGDAYFAGGNSDKAAEIYNTLIEKLGNDRKFKKDIAILKQRMGQIFESKGETDTALQYYNDAKKLDPTNIEILVTLANLYMKIEDFNQAERMFKSLLFQKLGDFITKADIYYNLALLERKKGDEVKAKSFIKRGLTESPEHPQLKALNKELS